MSVSLVPYMFYFPFVRVKFVAASHFLHFMANKTLRESRPATKTRVKIYMKGTNKSANLRQNAPQDGAKTVNKNPIIC